MGLGVKLADAATAGLTGAVTGGIGSMAYSETTTNSKTKRN